ncbi:glycosyltransferase [Cupriavidus necator]
MQEDRIYVFVDPFNSETSGVSAYINEAVKALSYSGLKSVVLAVKRLESIEAFRERLAREVLLMGKRIWMVEAPESLAASAKIPVGVPIHIRLHLSRQVGKILQGHKADQSSVMLEQCEIDRAIYISAPSESAVALSEAAFRLPSRVIVYGNPIESRKWVTTEKRFAALFIGRWQALKGVAMLPHLLPYLSGRKIGILTDRKAEFPLPAELVRVSANSNKEKRELIRQSHCVIVPSLFETASMVGLEALSVGVPVVTWNHIGLSEYAGYPMVLAVEPFDLSQFALALKSVSTFSTNTHQWDCRIARINEGFAEVIAKMSRGEDFSGTFGLLPPPNKAWLKIIDSHRESVMINNERSGFSRKFRKLRRDPVAFFRDSWIADLFVPPGSKLKVKSEAKTGIISGAGPRRHADKGALVAPTSPELPSSQPLMARTDLLSVTSELAEPQIIVKPKAALASANQSASENQPTELLAEQSPQVHSTELAADIGLNEVKSQRRLISPSFSVIKEGERIIFGNVENRRIGWRVGFFYSDEYYDLAEELISRMNEFEDFRPLKKDNVYIGRFEISESTTALSLINRIDVANKARISAVDHIIMLNAPQALQSALRASGTTQRIIAIDTLGKGREAAAADVDVLISTALDKESLFGKTLRREITVADERMIAYAIRRAIQEGGPKSPDMLIPLVGGDEFFPDFFDFDVRRYQGFIKINENIDFRSKSLEQFCGTFARSVVSMHVLDSVYCQYRSLCEDVERGESVAELLCATLKDGILFDVRH